MNNEMNKSFTAWVWRCFVLHVLDVLDPLTDEYILEPNKPSSAHISCTP